MEQPATYASCRAGQLGGFVTVLAVNGDRAYVATGARLTVVQLGVGDSPTLLGTSDMLPIHGPFHHLAPMGDWKRGILQPVAERAE
jgi:hypothetical protein